MIPRPGLHIPSRLPLRLPLRSPFGAQAASGGGLAPDEIASMQNWRDATDTGTIALVSPNVVQEISDKGPGNITMAAAGVPTTEIVNINGLNAIGMDGTNDWLANGSAPLQNDVTFAIMCHVISASSASDSILSVNAGTDDFQISAGQNGPLGEFAATVYSTGLGTPTMEGPTDLVGTDIFVVLIYNSVSGTAELRINGVSVLTDNGYNGVMNSLPQYFIGVNRGINLSANMKFAMDAVFFEALSGATLAGLETWSQERFAWV